MAKTQFLSFYYNLILVLIQELSEGRNQMLCMVKPYCFFRVGVGGGRSMFVNPCLLDKYDYKQTSMVYGLLDSPKIPRLSRPVGTAVPKPMGSWDSAKDPAYLRLSKAFESRWDWEEINPYGVWTPGLWVQSKSPRAVPVGRGCRGAMIPAKMTSEPLILNSFSFSERIHLFDWNYWYTEVYYRTDPH